MPTIREWHAPIPSASHESVNTKDSPSLLRHTTKERYHEVVTHRTLDSRSTGWCIECSCTTLAPTIICLTTLSPTIASCTTNRLRDPEVKISGRPRGLYPLPENYVIFQIDHKIYNFCPRRNLLDPARLTFWRFRAMLVGRIGVTRAKMGSRGGDYNQRHTFGDWFTAVGICLAAIVGTFIFVATLVEVTRP